MKVSIDMKVLDSWIASVKSKRIRLEDLERAMNVVKTKVEKENEKSLKDLILDCCEEDALVEERGELVKAEINKLSLS